MHKFLLAIICFGFLTINCQSAKPFPEFSAPIEIVDNRPFVKVKIKERFFHFVIDTGGYNSIELDAANALNLELGNKFQTGGAGEKSVDGFTTVIDSFEIADKKFANRRFYVLPLKEIKEGLKLPFLDGIIGYDFFGDAILQIDYPQNTVSFLNKYESKNAAPFSIYASHIPQIAVEIDDIKSEFVIDTGDRSQLTLGQSFSEQVLKQNKYELSEEKITGYGLGGVIMARTFDLKSLKLGTVETTNVLTRIPNVKSGAFAQKNFIGSIGSGFLKNYKITFDYRKKLLWIE